MYFDYQFSVNLIQIQNKKQQIASSPTRQTLSKHDILLAHMYLSSSFLQGSLTKNLPPTIQVLDVRFCPNKTVAVLTQDSRILITPIKPTEAPPVSVQVEPGLLHFELVDNILFYSTEAASFVYSLNEHTLLYKTISGKLHPLGGRDFLLATTTTLYQSQFLQETITLREIRNFDYGIIDSLTSPMISSKKLLRNVAVTSNITYLFSLETNDWTELRFAFSEIVFVDKEYVCGWNIHRDSLVVRSIQADMTIYSYSMNPQIGVFKVLIDQEQLYVLDITKLTILSINQETKPQILSCPSSTDIQLSKNCIYLLTNTLQLFGYRFPAVSSLEYNRNAVTPTKKPSVSETIPRTLQKPIASEEPKESQHSLKPQDQTKHESYENVDTPNPSEELANEEEILDIMKVMIQQHSKFMSAIIYKGKCLNGIHKWWFGKNERAALSALQQQEDLNVLHDSLKIMKADIHRVPNQMMTVLFDACYKLVASKYTNHVELGLEFMNDVLMLLREIRIQIENNSSNTANSIVQAVRNFRKHPRLDKIIKTKVIEDKKQIFQSAFTLMTRLDKYMTREPFN